MELEKRVQKDIELFTKNCGEVEESIVKSMARKYYEDALYYMEKKDYVTAFGCIAYAHGLIDAIRLQSGEKVAD